jgi:hypothetical protein
MFTFNSPTYKLLPFLSPRVNYDAARISSTCPHVRVIPVSGPTTTRRHVRWISNYGDKKHITGDRQQGVAALRLERCQVERLLTRRWIPHIKQVWLLFSVLGIDSSFIVQFVVIPEVLSIRPRSSTYQLLYSRGLGAHRGFHVQRSGCKGSDT